MKRSTIPAGRLPRIIGYHETGRRAGQPIFEIAGGAPSVDEQRATVLAEAQAIVDGAAAEGRKSLNESEQKALGEKLGTVKALDEQASKAANSDRLLAELGAAGRRDERDAGEDGRQKGFAGLGSALTGSAAYKSWKNTNPSGVGSGTPITIDGGKVGRMSDLRTKADPAPLSTPAGHVAPIRFPTVDLVARIRLTLLDLVTRGETAGAFEYLQIVSVTEAADIVAEALTATGTLPSTGLKPLSTFATGLADAKVYTYADGYTVTNSMLADAPAVATYLDSRLGFQLNSKVEDILLNGTGTNGQPAGILHTDGTQAQAFDGSMFRTIRKAITKVTRIGGTVTAVLLSPEDDEEWDLAQDADGRFLSGGPFATGPGTAWGRPRVVSERLQRGQFVLGDFSTVGLFDREGVSVLAFNQHEDYARRNLTYVRAELRAAQAVFEPAKLVIGEASDPDA